MPIRKTMKLRVYSDHLAAQNISWNNLCQRKSTFDVLAVCVMEYCTYHSSWMNKALFFRHLFLLRKHRHLYKYSDITMCLLSVLYLLVCDCTVTWHTGISDTLVAILQIRRLNQFWNVRVNSPHSRKTFGTHAVPPGKCCHTMQNYGRKVIIWYELHPQESNNPNNVFRCTAATEIFYFTCALVSREYFRQFQGSLSRMFVFLSFASQTHPNVNK